MPTLQFKGKNIIWNHHLSVPYHTLEEVSKLHFQTDKPNGNLIIEGDNLLALKALLPMYAGKAKVVCIDPPYNTGNEGWAYNDNVNSPLIKDWLGKEVGKDDLTRHDKWLCMMTPRLKLLRELLVDDGVVFVNIDENEQYHLRLIMDEIFHEANHIATFVWSGRSGKGGTTKQVELNHEYIECYSKDATKVKMKPVINIQGEGNYKDKKSTYKREHLRQWGQGDRREDRPSMYFPIILPNGEEIYPKRSDGADGRWRFGESTVKKLHTDNDLDFVKDEEGNVTVYRKIREGRESIVATDSLLIDKGTASSGTLELKKLFGEKVFDNVKPTTLIKHLIDLVTYDDRNAVILDSFSGSGTTGHAVMDLNKEDGGNRKFILVQMTETTEKEPKKNICKDITRERIKRAIEKYGYDSGFKYLRVGQPLDAETLLEGKLPDYKTFARYMYYLCTGENLKDEKKISEKKFFVGDFGNQAIYLIYKQDYEALTRMALNLEVAERIIAEQPNKKRIVYAPACFLDEEYMEEKQIEFVSIPYNLFQRKG